MEKYAQEVPLTNVGLWKHLFSARLTLRLKLTR